MKFGGASVATVESFGNIAAIIAEQVGEVIVVVSAMGAMTDTLLEMAHTVNPKPPERERDMLITAGERMSSALLAMALARVGKEAMSFTGSQSGIITSSHHGEAQIVDVRPTRIAEVLKEGKIPIVAGFQGVSIGKEITTLGRGGSDTTAVALAIAFEADVVEFYKDVDGIYERDPHRDESARRFDVLSYEEAIAIAHEGGILSPRSISLASKNNLPLCVRAFTGRDGMTVVGTPGSGRPLEKVFENGSSHNASPSSKAACSLPH
jgi:aspartate kinase